VLVWCVMIIVVALMVSLALDRRATA